MRFLLLIYIYICSYEAKYICERTKEVYFWLKKIILFLNISTALFIIILYFILTEIGNDLIGKIALISQLIYMIVGIY